MRHISKSSSASVCGLESVFVNSSGAWDNVSAVYRGFFLAHEKLCNQILPVAKEISGLLGASC